MSIVIIFSSAVSLYLIDFPGHLGSCLEAVREPELNLALGPAHWQKDSCGTLPICSIKKHDFSIRFEFHHGFPSKS